MQGSLTRGNVAGYFGNFVGGLARPYTTDIKKTAIQTGVDLTTGAAGAAFSSYAKRKLAGPVVTSFEEGRFSIADWKGYPSGVPKPAGPLKLISGEEYREARRAADAANRAIRASNPDLVGKQLHEIAPVKFGGNPTDLSNKVSLTPEVHYELNNYWNSLQRYLEKN
jgi:hypothetical protein